MRGVRKALPEKAVAARTALIVQRLEAIAPIAQARAVALFWPMDGRHEVDLRPLDARLRERGARVAYPRVDEVPGEMTFRFVEDLSAMQEHDRWGLREPAIDDPYAAPGELDVIIVPALAVDSRGHRIGYGLGYYDRALPRFAPPAVTVAVAFDFQLVPEVPDTPQDVCVAWIATDARTLQTAGT
jgi:5-formyltetrahydrofolate cyclo-ligase